MGNLIKAEFRKTLSLKTWWVLLIPLVLVAFWLTFVWGKITNDFADFIGSREAREIAGPIGLDPDKLPVGLLAFAHGVNIAQMGQVPCGRTGVKSGSCFRIRSVRSIPA